MLISKLYDLKYIFRIFTLFYKFSESSTERKNRNKDQEDDQKSLGNQN